MIYLIVCLNLEGLNHWEAISLLFLKLDVNLSRVDSFVIYLCSF